jgi:acyl-coenzyme A thioesterase PaaI-like protein
MAKKTPSWRLRWINWWPPFLAMGIRVTRMSNDLRAVDVEMRLLRRNANYVGTHFGGSLYAMADPFFMLMLIHNLGPGYIVWDKAATIRFRRPGRGTVRAEFRLSAEQLEGIRSKLAAQEKHEPVFTAEIKDEEGNVVAEVEKLLYVRKKDAKREQRPTS